MDFSVVVENGFNTLLIFIKNMLAKDFVPTNKLSSSQMFANEKRQWRTIKNSGRAGSG